jgi:hypothetical protein
MDFIRFKILWSTLLRRKNNGSKTESSDVESWCGGVLTHGGQSHIKKISTKPIYQPSEAKRKQVGHIDKYRLKLNRIPKLGEE